MPGLLFPAYQKLYSALSHLERFDKEANFFDNISAIDGFFTEYRNVTFVMQASLRHTEYLSAYEKNRDQYLKDHWFVEKRNETIKQKPFDLVKEVKIMLYLPFGGFTVSEKKFVVGDDASLDTIFAEIKDALCKADKHEVCFSVSFLFHEADSDIDLLKRVLQGISSMMDFMEAMEQEIGEQCTLCDELKERITKIYAAIVPLDFLLVNDYTYYPDKDCFDKAERVKMMMAFDGKVASHRPLAGLTQAEHFNFDGTAFGNFTLMHAMLRAMKPGMDIMPAIMVVYDDETYDLDAFDASMKTTMYRRLSETAQLVEEGNVREVCLMSLYSVLRVAGEMPKTSSERIQQATTDILVCASIDSELNEKEYVFDGKQMECMQYVAYVMKKGLKRNLGVSAVNLSPIKRAFKNRQTTTSQ